MRLLLLLLVVYCDHACTYVAGRLDEIGLRWRDVFLEVGKAVRV